MKVSQRLDNLNQIVSSPVLNKLNLVIPNCRTHKQVDEAKQAVIETIEKQGHKYLINDNGTIAIVPKKADPKPKKKNPPKAKPAPQVDVETVELVTSIIAATEAEGAEWYNTGKWVFNRKALLGTDAKQNRKLSYKLMSDTSGDSVPEKGYNDKNDLVDLRKPNGAVKWSAWEKTRRWTQYFSRMFQAVEAFGWDIVFPKGQLISKGEIDELLKEAKSGPGQAPHETFLNAVNMATGKVADCDPEFLKAMQEKLDELNAEFSEFAKNAKK